MSVLCVCVCLCVCLRLCFFVVLWLCACPMWCTDSQRDELRSALLAVDGSNAASPDVSAPAATSLARAGVNSPTEAQQLERLRTKFAVAAACCDVAAAVAVHSAEQGTPESSRGR